jgi:sterol desaturase/sphingolipid hydroxylase (fatty acid hydroxylase superfamily)
VVKGRRRPALSGGARLKGLTLTVITWVAMGATLSASNAFLQRLGVRPLWVIPPSHLSGLARAAMLTGGSAAGILLSDFFYYWFHRLQHKPLLWRFHAVHHAIEDLSGINYGHWTEGLWRFPFIALPMAFLLPDGLPVWSLTAVLATAQSQYIHSPTRLHFGPFWRLALDNRFHRIHHSLEPRHFDKNFGVNTPLWDWLFGTLYVPSKDEWPDTGLPAEGDIDGLGDFLWRPFRAMPLPAPALSVEGAE